MENKVVGYIPRLLFRIYLNLKDKFDPKPPVPEEVETCTHIVLKVLSYEDTELVYAPVSNKRFIVNEEKGMAITIENRVIHIINHVYSYSIYMENNECYGKILKKFDDISEKKKNELEVKLTNNIKHSLNKILEGLS
jgi:hypothetical protein